jgi:hypothetical protein
MKLFAIEGNTQRLDGGAMFGNAPKELWETWIKPDDHNRILLACRSLLCDFEDGNVVLFEAGIGAFFEPKLKERFGVVESDHILLQNLALKGYKPQDVTHVVLSHLHFEVNRLSWFFQMQEWLFPKQIGNVPQTPIRATALRLFQCSTNFCLKVGSCRS